MTDLPPGLGDQIGSLMAGQALPAQLQQLYSQLYPLQLAEPMAQFGLDQSLANQSYGNTLASLGIQKGALGRQQTYLPQEQALQKQLLGLSGEDLGLQRQQLGLRGQSLDITQQQEQEQAEMARRGAWSGATARGATNTQGFRQGLGDISQNLQNQLAQLGLSRQGLGLQGQGLDIQGQRLGIEGQQQDIGNILQSGSLQDQLAQLGLNYGIAGQTLQNSIGQAAVNAQSGTVNTALGQINSLGAGAAQIPIGAGQAGALGSAIQPPAYPAPLSPPPNTSPIIRGGLHPS